MYRNITKIVRNMMLFKNRKKEQEVLNETEYEMLRYITKRDKRTFSDVSGYLNVDKGLITRMSKHLSNLGYITITNDIKDRRIKYLSATNLAKELKYDRESIENNFYDAITKVLTEEEKVEFLRLVDKVYLESKRLRKDSFRGIDDEIQQD